MTVDWSAEQLAAFERDGFVVVEGFVDAQAVEELRGRFEPIFAGRYETGIRAGRGELDSGPRSR